MRITKLRLLAFGPFTDLTLDFSRGASGLDVVYGPNEAGKSSALRAIRDLLFGIPQRSSDNFIHSYSALRIGASLAMSDGDTLDFVRRKANRQSLRGADDQTPLADDVLDRFLAGIDEATFLTMFGVNHSRLVKGGQEILDGGGSVGKVLFAAGSGLADLHSIQSRLTADAESLFKPSGRNPRINQAVHEWQAARRDMGRIQLSVDEWSRHETELRRAEKRKTDLDDEINQKRRERNRLTRIHTGAPVVARWRRENAELEGCHDAPLLSEDFASRRGQALIELRTAEQQERDATEESNRLAAQVDSLKVRDDLLAEAATIEHLRERLGSHRKAMSDRPGLETSRQLAEKDAVELLRKIGRSDLATDIEALRLPADKVVRIQNLANQYEGLVQKLDAARRERDRLYRARKQAEDRLATMTKPVDTTRLRNLVRRIQQEGDLEAQAGTIHSEITNLEKEIAIDLARLALWKGTADDLERLSVPSADFVEEIEREGVDCEALKQRIERLDEEIGSLSPERDEVIRRIEGEKHDLAHMDGNDQAAGKAEECERLMAQLGEDLHQLAVVRVAAIVLRESIERYRKKNQGPVLDCASQLFAEMTRGSYEELRAEFGDQGEPVLVGVRPGGKETVGVKGMSDGTCDQLYFSLRIASLQVWLNNHEPMPFIVDDVLLNFDDDRATAALKVLARLSQRTQVIFFTHHQRLVELATGQLGSEGVTIHQLDSTMGVPA